MKRAHTVKLSVFVKEYEQEAPISDALVRFLGFDIEKEKITIERSRVEGIHEQKITIFEVLLQKERHVNAFLNALIERLTPEQKALLAQQADSRTSEDCDFYIRFDKPKLLKNELAITESGDCFHCKITLASYPKRKEAALKIIKEMFK